MDHIDKELLNIIQKDFPLVQSPFKLLGDQVGLSESETINKIVDLKCNKNIIRDISAIFNTKVLGITSALIAINTESSNLEALADAINENPLVSHNYLRDNKYNIWFTVSMASIDKINTWISQLKKTFKLENILVLPSKRVFKRNVFFNFSSDKQNNNYVDKQESIEINLNKTDKLILSLLEQDLPIIRAPFAAMAEKANIEENLFIEQAKKLKQNKVIRRYAAVLRHHKAGFTHNALIVWNINENEIEDIGKTFSSKEFVSHCYERVKLNDWNYNLYTMIHAVSENQLNAYVNELIELSKNSSLLILKTVKELKKERVKYFSNDENLLF